MKALPPGKQASGVPQAPNERLSKARRGFTLVEMLVVMAVIVVLIALVKPTFDAINGANNLTGAINGIAGTFEQARAYAVANNTYVYTGILETDDSTSTSATLQHGVPGGQGGRVIIVTVASKNGLSGYDVNDPVDTWTSGYGNGANLVVVGKPITFENLHLADILLPTATPSNMQRPGAAAVYELGDRSCISQTPFSYPMGSPIDSGYQYLFNKVVEFDPQGTARIIVTAADADSNPLEIEVGLLPSHGAGSPTPPSNPNVGQQAAIQVDGITGAVRIYRP